MPTFPTSEVCESLALSLGITDFDLLLVGDGAGSLSHTPSGWYCTAYWRPTRKVTIHFGGASGGTNNYAELVPYLQTLCAFHAAWLDHHPDKRLDVHVVVVTDSEVTAYCGSGRYRRKANLSLWASVDWFSQNGYHIEWRHVPRNSNQLSSLADHNAKKLRRLMEGIRTTDEFTSQMRIET